MLYSNESRIVKNDLDEYSVVDNNGRILVPFGIYDSIEMFEANTFAYGKNWIYQVKINHFMVSGLDFGVKFGLISGSDGLPLTPVVYDKVELDYEDYGLKLYCGSHIDFFEWDCRRYFADQHKIMTLAEMQLVIKYFQTEDTAFINNIIREYSSAKVLELTDFGNCESDLPYKEDQYLLVSYEEYNESCELNGYGYGIFNKLGELIVPCKYLSIEKVNRFGRLQFVQEIVVDEGYHKHPYYHYSHLGVGFNGNCELEFLFEDNGYKYFKENCNYSIYFHGEKVVEFDDVEGIRALQGHLVPIRKNNKWGLQDFNHNIIIPFEYSYIYAWNNNVVIVKKSNYYGLIDIDNNVLVDFKYEQMYLEEGLLRCKQINGLWGVVDTQGNVIIPFNYKQLFEISEGLIGALDSNNKIGFISTDNEVALPFEFWYPGEQDNYRGYEPVFKYGLSIVNNGNHFGFINHKGESVFPFVYCSAETFKNNKAIVGRFMEETAYGELYHTFELYLDGTEKLIDEYFHETESEYYDFDLHQHNFRNERDDSYIDLMDAYDDLPDALWNTD